MPGLIPEFTMGDINRRIDKFHQAKVRKCFEVLSYVGIECVKFAKKHHGYMDQTGNLTSSIGYAVIYDGEIKKSMMMHETGAALVDQLARQYPKGMVLVVVAGMEYAAAVESKGYDVITGSSQEGEQLMAFMREKLGAVFV